ncbi:hypothetical protein ACUH7Y_25400 [Clostridium beijerinckii]|uniref:Uncharacterized protein n=2 Tax=Clostridium TaxID=1485 RepID=A0AAV3W6L8_9CLOT|nr:MULTISPECIES: hypothetical protein [Clostridium]NMF06569.1 hypothetical protein [Clostridium beijerinckii]QES71622.1 hypothetical protein F3K33_01815 [Clostridium diolis]GEA33631.1 hypothetical protein CDIOL_45540 [Clostridium diolis]
MNVLEYIDDKKFRIYKKKLCSKKGGKYQIYYLIVYEDIIMDVFWEVEIGRISEGRLSYDNTDLIVYKIVEKIDNRYFSFWNKDRIEYRIGQEIQCYTEVGMFFCKTIEQARSENFSNRTDIAELTAKVKIDDLIGGDLRSLQFNKCTPIEIIC